MGTDQEGLIVTPAVAWSRWLGSLPLDRRTALIEVELDADGGDISVPCGGARHRARLTPAGLELLDHDVDAELTMVIFGGDLPSCLLYRAAWDGAFGDGFLAEWGADADGDRLDHARDDWYGNYWESWPREPSAARVLFGARLQRHLAVSVADQWPIVGGRDGPGTQWAAVRHAVAVRARRALVLSLASVDAHRRPDALVPVAITVVPEGRPSIGGTLSRRASYVEVTLPARWLGEVWARDLAVHDGRFVVGVRESELLTLEWKRTGRAGREHEPSLSWRRW